MNTDTMIALNNERCQRIRDEAAHERMVHQATTPHMTITTALRRRLGATFIVVGRRLQGPMPTLSNMGGHLSPVPADPTGN